MRKDYKVKNIRIASPLAPIGAEILPAETFFWNLRIHWEIEAESGNKLSQNAKCFALKNYFNETFIKFVRLTFLKVQK